MVCCVQKYETWPGKGDGDLALCFCFGVTPPPTFSSVAMKSANSGQVYGKYFMISVAGPHERRHPHYCLLRNATEKGL